MKSFFWFVKKLSNIKKNIFFHSYSLVNKALNGGPFLVLSHIKASSNGYYLVPCIVYVVFCHLIFIFCFWSGLVAIDLHQQIKTTNKFLRYENNQI